MYLSHVARMEANAAGRLAAWFSHQGVAPRPSVVRTFVHRRMIAAERTYFEDLCQTPEWHDIRSDLLDGLDDMTKLIARWRTEFLRTARKEYAETNAAINEYGTVGPNHIVIVIQPASLGPVCIGNVNRNRIWHPEKEDLKDWTLRPSIDAHREYENILNKG